MLNRSDVDVNCFRCFRDSSKEKIRHTMVNQELVFRKQVIELHQLYRVQRAMMEDFKQNGLDNHNLHNVGMSPISLSLNSHLRCSMKPLNLQLSADEFINQCVNDFSGKRVVTSLKGLVVSKGSSLDSVVLNMDHLNLPLDFGQDAKIIGGEHRCWKGKETCSSSIGVIDLDANLSSLNYEAYPEANPGSLAPKPLFGHKNNLDSFLINEKHNLENYPQSGLKDGSYGTTLIRSLVHAGASCQSQSLSDLGLNRHCKVPIADNLSNKKQDSPTCKVNNLDLNTVQLEDLSSLSNDHSIVVNSSITSSSPMLEKLYPKFNVASSVSPVSWREADVNQSTNLHDFREQKDSNLENMGEQCSMVGKLREGNIANISFMNLESDSSGEFCSGRPRPNNSSVGSTSKISNGLSCELDLVDAVKGKVILEKTVKHFEHTNSCKLPTFSESQCMIDHQSSSIKTMQSGVECDDINKSTPVEREQFNIGPLVTHSGEQDLRSSDSTESNTHRITKEPKVDGKAQLAAELLLQISLVTGTFCEGDLAKMPVKKTQNEEDNQPQCSSESYETMALEAEECSPDSYRVSSNAFVVDESEKKDVRYKLKRGTRMKDFQKDILPCLSTLSRHEIREDVNILEGVIRSREYKKMRAKMADGGGDFCRSTRSKRSRISRRYYV